ncbi:FG-GAP-like repeat-containing protein [Streptomyces diastatochromogenes]|uniref:FG-GAP-like repeat-containing protein n=1 Tax=Streptomyces diastatochromogenes TaxID=42236 RepID=UPI003694F750
MGRRALIRGGIAAATTLTLAMGLGPLALDAHADAPTEVVIPAETSLLPRTSLLSAGPSGFLRYEPGRGHLWTTYTGEDTVVDASATEVWGMPEFGAGSDVVARYDDNARTVSLRDMAAGGTTATLPLPSGHTYRGTLGRTVVTTAWSDGNSGWHLLDLQDDGTVRDRPVAGVPDGIDPMGGGDSPVGDAHGMVVQYRAGETVRSAWLDADEGKLVVLPYNPTINVTGRTVLTATHLVSWDGSTVSVYSRDDLTTAVRTVPLADDGPTHLMGMVGDTLLVCRYDSSLGAKDGSLPVWRVDAVAPDGSTTGTVLARTRSLGLAVPTPDGGLLVPGSGPDTADWGVNLVRAGSDGTPVVKRVAAAELKPETDPVQALTLDGGRLTVTENDRDLGRTVMYSRSIGTTGDTLTVGSRTLHGFTEDNPTLVGTGDGRTVVWNLWVSNGDRVPRVVQPTGSLPGTPVDPRHDYVRVWDAKGRHVAMAPHYTDAAGAATRVIDLDTGGTVLTSPQLGTALWGTTLWVLDDNGGAVPVDVRTGKRGEPVWFGPKCRLEDLKAAGRWLLWSCAGSGESQGVYDTVAKTKLTLTEGAWETAQLGDGFVVTDVDGTLKVTDVRSGTPVSHTVGTLPSWQSWDVDPYTGLIAYVDAKGDIHVVSSGVPLSPLTQLDAAVAGTADVKGGAAPWSPKWWLSKPAASWQLVIRHKATGATVRTLSGGTAQGVLPASWNGKDTAGKLVPNGAYTWTLTATPADGQGAALTKTGTVKVTGATPVRRDFATSDGFGELLTLNGSGGLTYQYGTGTGTLTGKRTGSGWPTTVKAVPFGDLSGDRCNDVLVRLSSGTLRAYRPACGSAVTPSTAYTSLGTGWNQYDVLTSPGDVSGDGRADLIARQASSGDVYLYKATSTGKLSARVRIASRWTGYKKILGAGDLNGDGYGDLLAQDRSNELWRYDGTATGKFKSRVKVFDDWGSSYNAVVGVGDLTGDGRADLVARDTSGNVWRSNGNGKGSFGSRTKIAGGWQSYKGVF